jgi:hypothetical protein
MENNNIIKLIHFDKINLYMKRIILKIREFILLKTIFYKGYSIYLRIEWSTISNCIKLN